MASVSIAPFDTNNNARDIAQRWSDWTLFLDDYFALQKVTQDADKLLQLKVYGGASLARIVRNDFKDVTIYKDVIDGITKQFSPVTVAPTSVSDFRKIAQYEGETFDSFVARVTAAAVACDLRSASQLVQLHQQSATAQPHRRQEQANARSRRATAAV